MSYSHDEHSITGNSGPFMVCVYLYLQRRTNLLMWWTGY